MSRTSGAWLLMCGQRCIRRLHGFHIVYLEDPKGIFAGIRQAAPSAKKTKYYRLRRKISCLHVLKVARLSFITISSRASTPNTDIAPSRSLGL